MAYRAEWVQNDLCGVIGEEAAINEGESTEAQCVVGEW